MKTHYVIKVGTEFLLSEKEEGYTIGAYTREEAERVAYACGKAYKLGVVDIKADIRDLLGCARK